MKHSILKVNKQVKKIENNLFITEENSMIKNKAFQISLATILIGFLALGGIALAESEKPTCDASLTVYSQYIWRGYELSKDSVVFFPEITVSYKGFGFTIWGDLDTDFVGENTDNRMEMFETDYVLTYSNNVDMLKYTLGWIYYDVDGGEDQEVYAVLGLDTFLSPEISVWRGIEHTDSWYFNFAISHSFELQNGWSIDVGGWIAYYDIPDGDIDGSDYNEWHDATIWAGLNIPLNDWCTLTPSINYSFALSGDSEDYLEAKNKEFADDKESNFFYGGVTLAISF